MYRMVLMICLFTLGIYSVSARVGDCHFNICEHVPNYPEKNIKKIIEQNQELHSYFGNIVEPSMSIATRFGNNDFESFCTTIDKTVLPKSMTDVNDDQKEIANIAGYHQVVKYQVCDFSKQEQCFGGNLLDRQTKCVQQFHIVKLLTVNKKNNTLEYGSFRVPSTCVCAYV